MSNAEAAAPSKEWRAFLLDSPPGARALVEQAALHKSDMAGCRAPELSLYCPKCAEVRTCHGNGSARRFLSNVGARAHVNTSSRQSPFAVEVSYFCFDCDTLTKTYFVNFLAFPGKGDAARCLVEKATEYPPFRPALPTRALSLVGASQDLLAKGRRAEAEGLGIGAFAYYRQIVEAEWKRLLSQIITAAKRLNVAPEMMAKLELALKETQFRKAVEMVKDAIPERLLIKGHNPLTVLYGPLSDGLHAQTDAWCLERATAIRVIIGELATRLAAVMQDDREVDDALNTLMNGPPPASEGIAGA